jgi:hypothetical protein
MRKITAGVFIALDGVVEAPDQWHFPYFNDEMGAAVDASLGAAESAAGVHLAQLRTAAGRAHRGGHYVEERAQRREHRMSGSVSVVRQLLAAGLLDELHLLVHPIAVREGMRLFDEGEPSIPFTLISSQTFETGVLNLVYTPAESAGNAGYEEAKAHLAQLEQ